jgi:hypothetical protein
VIYLAEADSSEPSRTGTAGVMRDSVDVVNGDVVNGDVVNGPVSLSVIVPTRNEMANIAVLIKRLGRAVAPLSAEIVVVDDSDDDTPAAVALHARTCPVPVRLLHRQPGQRQGGLSGAVMAGTP